MAEINLFKILIKQLYIISLPVVLFGNLERSWAGMVDTNISQENIPVIDRGVFKLQISKQLFKVSSPDKSIARSISFAQKYLAQKVPDNIGAPTGRRKGGATRDPKQCSSLEKPITALVPGGKSGEKNKSFFASTVDRYLNVWLFVPQLTTPMKFGEFVLQDDSGNDILRKRMSLPHKAGVIGISIPQNPQYALKKNHKYQWYFQVYCGDPKIPREYAYVDAWLQRVALNPNLQKQLETTKRGKYAIYSKNHLWYDAVSDLAKLRTRNPNSQQLARDWANLLKIFNLEEFVDVPIIKNYVLSE
ncbi:DUF928 domain-containing protein [Mastigocoleus testarum]|uniref:DUF928 domain-containing protein n=1 Tax=Mastigocoleus testarum BC008 TaxID=371196 RepID=A0A0V7ZP81_9CYAN|nr:DUF928 domain-containing protein [Mastigocoleus testarum]KST66380.1 hypothetical protein BC008_25760 [Mastigocoleus testarum BC008]KST66701.1 hypothetical protein BC008_26285 [Mastigocoleus testarum BC008]